MVSPGMLRGLPGGAAQVPLRDRSARRARGRNPCEISAGDGHVAEARVGDVAVQVGVGQLLASIWKCSSSTPRDG